MRSIHHPSIQSVNEATLTCKAFTHNKCPILQPMQILLSSSPLFSQSRKSERERERERKRDGASAREREREGEREREKRGTMLTLDPQVRNWVMIPITFAMLLIGILRHLVAKVSLKSKRRKKEEERILFSNFFFSNFFPLSSSSFFFPLSCCEGVRRQR